MIRAVWIHQFSQLSERTAQDIADTLLPRGITDIYVKAMDGTDWMGKFYDHPLAPTNINELAATVGEFRSVGLRCLPWVVNRFYAAEATAHIECGRIAGGLIIDFEYHYQGFWQGTNFEAQTYFDKLRAAVQSGVWIAVAPDPRQLDRDYQIRSLLGGLSAYLPQDYWTDFKSPALDVVIDSFLYLAQFGPVQPIFPYNATPDDMQAALAYSFGHYAAEGVSLWRMGTANANQLDAFAQRVPGEEDPMNCDIYKAAIERAVNRLQIELAKKTIPKKPVREIANELFQALQT